MRVEIYFLIYVIANFKEMIQKHNYFKMIVQKTKEIFNICIQSKLIL